MLEASLDKARLLLCFECNRQDFINEAGIAYADCVQNPALAEPLSRPGFDETSGFAFFADYIMKIFTAAPSSRHTTATDKSGHVISTFLLRHVPQVPSLQQLMTKDGPAKYNSGMETLKELSWYVAIKAFESGIADWQEKDLARAKKQRQQLVDRKRELYCASF